MTDSKFEIINKYSGHNQCYPKSIQFSPTEKCNLMCFHCYRKKWKNELLNDDLDISIISNSSVKQAIKFCDTAWIVSGGEPLLYKNFKELVKFINEYNVSNIYTITNATLINDDYAEFFVKNKITHLKISMEGATEKMHDSIRGIGVFKKLKQGIEKINYWKKVYNSEYPKIIITFVIMKKNFEELLLLVKFAKEQKIRNIEVHHCQVVNDDLINMSMFNLKEEYNAVVSEAKKLAQKYNIELTHPPLFDMINSNRNKVYTKCNEPWEFFFIDQQGNVYPCCHLWGHSFGNVYKNTFQEIWNGENFLSLRKEILENGYGEMCKKSTCPKINYL